VNGATLVLIARHQVNLGHIACKSDGVCTSLIQFSDDKILACTPDLLIPRSACWLLLRHGLYSLEYPTFRTAMIFDCDNLLPNLPTLVVNEGPNDRGKLTPTLRGN
jgi:hypothetical protein